MCGICGAYNYGSMEPVRAESILAMNDLLRHRGPDGQGFFNAGNFAMAMSRLSIIDLATGRQPIHNEDKSIWVVFNGEIYNYKELSDELIKKGHQFYTRSDTEVIVHLFEEEGINFISRLNGMFAIALWVEPEKVLYLIRDRLGIKPLFYHCLPGRIVFSSELKSLARFESFEKEIDPLSLARYLAFDYVPAPHSIYKNTFKVRPGHFLKIHPSGTEEIGYWDLHYEPKLVKSEEEYLDELDALLRRSVKRRLISDVPLGAFLSGGVDSSLIAALMVRVSDAPVKTFTISFDDPSFDESHWASKVAAYLGVDHHQERLSMSSMFSLLPEIGNFFDEPFGDGSFVPTYLLCRFTRANVTVSLSGDGGDELFIGYPTYQAFKLARWYEKLPDFVHRGLINPLVGRLPVSFDNISLDFKIKKFLSGIGYDPFVRNSVWLGTFTPPEIGKVLHPDIARLIDPEELYQPVIDYLQRTDAQEDLERILYLDMKLYLQDNMLVKIDRASMANSLEARVPYLDHEVVDFVCRVPVDVKFKRLQLKSLLKKLARRYLPAEIIDRPKKGFGMPIAKWLLSDAAAPIKDRILQFPHYDRRQVVKLIDEHCSRRVDHRKKIWNLYGGTFC